MNIYWVCVCVWGKWLFIFYIWEFHSCCCFFVFFFWQFRAANWRGIYFLDDPRRTNLRRLKSARGLPQDSSGQLGAKTQTHTGTHTDIGAHTNYCIYEHNLDYLICGERSSKYYPCIFHIIRCGAFFVAPANILQSNSPRGEMGGEGKGRETEQGLQFKSI